MADAYTFEFEGVTVTYHHGTVKSGIEANRILRKLISAYGYGGSDTMPADEFDNIDEYSAAMSRIHAVAPWRGHSNMLEADLKAAYELFLEQDETLYYKFRQANMATLAPKKTVLSVTETSTP